MNQDEIKNEIIEKCFEYLEITAYRLITGNEKMCNCLAEIFCNLKKYDKKRFLKIVNKKGD